MRPNDVQRSQGTDYLARLFPRQQAFGTIRRGDDRQGPIGNARRLYWTLDWGLYRNFGELVRCRTQEVEVEGLGRPAGWAFILVLACNEGA